MTDKRTFAAFLFITLLHVGAAYGFEVTTLLDNGQAGNRLDMVILGDGYTLEQQALLVADAQGLVDEFFAAEPFTSHQQRFNVHVVQIVSNEEGADYTDAAENADCPAASLLVDTVLGCAYCCNGLQRLICCDKEEAFGVLDQAFPEWDTAVIMVNSGAIPLKLEP